MVSLAEQLPGGGLSVLAKASPLLRSAQTWMPASHIEHVQPNKRERYCGINSNVMAGVCPYGACLPPGGQTRRALRHRRFVHTVARGPQPRRRLTGWENYMC